MQPKRFFQIGGFIALILLIVIGSFSYFHQPPRALEYEGVQTLRIGSHSATLETQSYAIAQGDNGAAKIIVLAGDEQTVLDTWFDNDLFNNIRPAYVSRQNVDDHWRRDLVIWQPTYSGGLQAAGYISSEDGRFYPLDPPFQRQRFFN